MVFPLLFPSLTICTSLPCFKRGSPFNLCNVLGKTKRKILFWVWTDVIVSEALAVNSGFCCICEMEDGRWKCEWAKDYTICSTCNYNSIHNNLLFSGSTGGLATDLMDIGCATVYQLVGFKYSVVLRCLYCSFTVVSRKYTFCISCSRMKLKLLKSLWNFLGLPFQRSRSEKCHQWKSNRGVFFWVQQLWKHCSKWAMNMFPYCGATSVPIAVPLIWRKVSKVR